MSRPKTDFKLYPNSQKKPIWIPKAQNDPDLGQKHKLKLKKAQKIKVFQLYE